MDALPVGPSPKSGRRAWPWGALAGLLAARVLAVVAPEAEMGFPGGRPLLMAASAVLLIPAGMLSAWAGPRAFALARQERSARGAWIVIAGLATLFFALSAMQQRSAARRFDREGRVAEGHVIATHPNNHNRIDVGYRVGERFYRSRAGAPCSASSFRPGDTVPIYYHDDSPEQGFCVVPRWQPGLHWLFWILLAVLMPMWTFGVIEAAGKRPRKP